MLTDAERRLLKALSEEWQGWEELSKKTGMNRDGVARTLFFLSQKGLAEMSEEKREEWKVTEEGRRWIKEGFPEEEVREWDGKSVRELPPHIREKLGWLKESGMVEIKEGRVVYKGGRYKLKEALERIGEGKEVEEKYLKELRKRGAIEMERVRVIKGRVTPKGLEELKKGEGEIGRLSREVLERGTWKGKAFRPFNIDIEAVKPWKGGYRHIVRKAIDEIKDVFVSMGFEEMEGRYVESAFWNFDALFQPQDHPSRELADTFYLEGKKLDAEEGFVEGIKKAHEAFWGGEWRREEAEKVVLRTHTTVLSARTLVSGRKGKFFAIGKVFRNEAIDYKHLAEFHQIEGIVAEEGVTFRHLLGILKEFYARLGFEEIRFRPSYFPYTEPSLEIEVWFEPKQEWVELGGAGMFRWEMLKAWGIEHNVLAWGLSLERPLMMLLGLEDIRDLYRNDIDFIREKSGFRII